MAVLNSDHLLQQAERLIAPPTKGPPRQVDLRRAISTSYYAVFHAVLTAAADRYVGSTRRANLEYGLLYRSVDHKRLRDLCGDLAKATPSKRYKAYLPVKGMSGFVSFAAVVSELQKNRHSADYDPMARFRTADAKAAILSARFALLRLRTLDVHERNAFLSLLVFPARS